jgi:hypothetical protein
MKIELRKFKMLKGLSQETLCFTADVYIDGVKAGEVSNEGHGGPHSFSPHALADRLRAYASSLPERQARIPGLSSDEVVKWQPTEETVIDDACDLAIATKDYLRDKKKYVIFVSGKDGDTYRVKMQPAFAELIRRGDKDGLLAAMKATLILNLMPDDEAIALLMYQE